jgi:hypothetical protein
MGYTEEDLREAFRAGRVDGANQSYFDKPLDEDEYIESLKQVELEEETIVVTYDIIKYGCGWSRFCDIAGYNHYAINDYGDFDKGTKFELTVSKAKELRLI